MHGVSYGCGIEDLQDFIKTAYLDIEIYTQDPLLQTWINFNPSMDE